MNNSLNAINNCCLFAIIFKNHSGTATLLKTKKQLLLNRRQVLIHSAYWITAFLCFTLLYSFIGSVSHGICYASISLPLIMGIAYFFIYRAVPYLLFNERFTLFCLITAIIFLGVLNIQIVFVLIKRIFLAENIAAEVAFVHLDTLYLMISTILFSLPAITYETLRNWSKNQKQVTQLQQNKRKEFLEVRSDGKIHRIACDSIYFIESFGDYVHINLENEKVITRMTLKKIDTQLPNFVRVHRSYIVNPDLCKAFNLNEIVVKEKEIPVGRTYKNDVSEVFNQNRRSMMSLC